MARDRGRILGDTEREILLKDKGPNELKGYYAQVKKIREEAFSVLPELILEFRKDLKILVKRPPLKYDKTQLEKNKKAIINMELPSGPKASRAIFTPSEEDLKKFRADMQEITEFRREKELIKNFEAMVPRQFKEINKIEKNEKLSNFFKKEIGAQIEGMATCYVTTHMTPFFCLSLNI
jgi:type I site-specific restriction endonuclease